MSAQDYSGYHDCTCFVRIRGEEYIVRDSDIPTEDK